MSIHPGKFSLFFLLGVSLAFCSTVSATSDAGSSAKNAKSACRDYLSNSEVSSLEHPQTLEDLLSALNTPFEKSDPFFSLPKVSIDFIVFPRIPAVQVEQVIVGKGGEGYFSFRRIGQTWRRHGGPNFFAPESDPTWVISTLGPRVAAFLGFRLIRSDLMYVPNSVLFNQRIAALNTLLKRHGFEEIPARWTAEIQQAVSPDGIKLSYSENYVREFYFENLAPFAPMEIVHDTAHHVLDVLWTQDQLAPIKARMGTLISFADFVRGLKIDENAYPLLSNPRYREAVIALLFQTQTRAKDNLSGNCPLLVLDDSPGESENNTFFRILRLHLGPEFAPIFTKSFDIQFNIPYTVGQWFNRLIFGVLFPLIENAPPLERDGDYAALQRLRLYTDKSYRGAISQLQLSKGQLSTEIADLYQRFKGSGATRRSEFDLILVEYDNMLGAIGGLAAKEHPLSALRRRAREFQAAIGE